MNTYRNMEERFFKDILIRNIFPELKDGSSIVVTKPMANTGDGFFTTQVMVHPRLASGAFFASKRVTYDRFRLGDYRKKSTDEYFEVPAVRVQNPQQLVNYMNEVFQHSSNVREMKDGHDIYRGFQIGLKVENLQPFNLNFPAPENTLFIQAAADSFLFEGSLSIKFV